MKLRAFNWAEATEKYNLKPTKIAWHLNIEGKYFSQRTNKEYSCIRSGQVILKTDQLSTDILEGIGIKLVFGHGACQLQEGFF